MKNISEKQKNYLCNMIAKMVFDLKKYNNVECITIQNKYNILIFKVIVKTNSLASCLKQDVKKWDIIATVKKEELGTSILFTFDESYLYNNVFDIERKNNIDLVEDFCNSSILFDRSTKYYRLQKELIDNNYNNLDLPF